MINHAGQLGLSLDNPKPISIVLLKDVKGLTNALVNLHKRAHAEFVLFGIPDSKFPD